MGRAGRLDPQFHLYSNAPYGRMWLHLDMGLDKSILNPTDAGPFSSQALAGLHVHSSSSDAFRAAAWVTGNANYSREARKLSRNC